MRDLIPQPRVFEMSKKSVYMTKEEMQKIEQDDFADRQARGKKIGEKLAKAEEKKLAVIEANKDRLAKILECDRKNIDEVISLIRSLMCF